MHVRLCVLQDAVQVGELSWKWPIHSDNSDDHSVFLPLVATVAALVEDGRRLVTWTNLNLHEIGALALAMAHVRALNVRRVRILPRFGTAEHIVYLFPLEVHFVLKLRLDAMYVGAGAAEKAEITQWLLC